MTEDQKSQYQTISVDAEVKVFKAMPKLDELIEVLKKDRPGESTANSRLELAIDTLIEIRNELQWRK